MRADYASRPSDHLDDIVSSVVWPTVLQDEKERMGEAPAETTRGSRDRLKGQLQERQHSAAAGGTRDRLPPASDSKAIS
jgi:hypothetical protein